MLLMLAALLFGPVAHAADDDGVADPTWYAGRVVASVELFSGDGGLPEGDLEPLLRARQNEPLDPAMLQLDLRTLYRVGPLAAVEADVVPWPVYDARVGELVEGVKVRYVVYPATRVHDVRVQGADAVPARRVAGAARLAVGDVFEPEHDTELIAERVREFLVHEGFPDAAVEVEAYPADAGEPFDLEVWLRVDEGRPRLLRDLTVEGVPRALTEGQIRRWIGRSGLRTGRPVADDALTRARLTVRQKLARLGPDRSTDDLFGPRTAAWLSRTGVLPEVQGGWVQARVSAEAHEAEDGSVDVAIAIDPGPRLVLRTEGVGYGIARDALGIDERLRLTRGFLEEAPDKIEAALARQGYLDATATVGLEQGIDASVLRVQANLGPRHRRRLLYFVDNDALTTTQLRTVLNQASSEVLRKRRLTKDELERGLEAARALYASVGHEKVRFRIGDLEITRRRPFLSLDRSQRWVGVTVRVDEGPVTRLESASVVGAAEDVELEALDEVLVELAGGPFSPQGLQALAQRIVDAHRGAGYLEAEARVRPARLADDRVEATLEIAPGPKILLRSFATRGNRRVDSRFLRRTVAPELGTPLTAQTLDNIRQQLYDLGMFGGLELSLVGDGAARDLVIDLRERPRHTVEAGLGLASDQGFRALGRWTMRNLFGPADRLDANALLGLRFASGAGRLGIFRTPEYRLGASHTTPLSRVSRLTINGIALEEIQERNWRSLRRALGVQWEVTPTRTATLQTGTQIAIRRLVDADPGAILANDVWSDPALALPEDPSVDTRFRVVDSVDVVWLDDHRDNPLQPTRGVLYQARTSFSPSLIQPGYARGLRVPTLAAEARVAAVTPLAGMSLRVSAEGGHQRVLPIGRLPSFTVEDEDEAYGPAVPVEQRYRLGGTASLRGFRRDWVGPVQRTRQLDLDWPDALAPAIAYSLRDDDTRWVPTGGDTYAKLTADLLVPLPLLGLAEWDGYDIALFADVGQVWFQERAPVTSAKQDVPWLRVGAGVGFRVITPVGPLQADLAFNPQRIFSRGERKTLLAEQWDEPTQRLHLSLGTLF